MAVSTSNFPEVKVGGKFGNGLKIETREIKGRALAEHWFVTPFFMRGGKPHSKKRCLTHASGLAAITGLRYKVIAELWEKVKDLDIHYATEKELKASPDYEKLGAVCEQYHIRQANGEF